MKDGKPKTVVVTGAGEGLGRVLARRLAADGDRVILLGRTGAKVEAVAEDLGPPHFAVQCDVSDPIAVRSAFAVIAERCPRIDVLINNAAIFEPFLLQDATDRQIADHLAVNFAGPVYCARSALPLLKGGGHIINVTSESVALKMPMLWMYAGTKAGLSYVSEMWNRELEEDGVRVTVVQAGQMMDETKQPPSWPVEVATRFAQENAKVGLNLRERPISHYRSVTDVFRAILDTPSDLHIGSVAINAARPSQRDER